ncbi:MAG: hypothetical protein HRT67_07050 [Flavobacteriaceae bacterium]|nr:hypothetical protein [Flavobacteriaceae bacterium]
MKKIVLHTTLFICLFYGNALAQQEKGIIGFKNWLNPWAEFKPNKIKYNKATQILSGSITQDMTLYKHEVYLLSGDVFVTDSTTLTIEPGTLIIGDFESKGALIITNGSKIIAEGEHTDPIVFTSSRSVKKPGDWGGITILGNAPTSINDNRNSINYNPITPGLQDMSYNGEDSESNSGILKYVRIEYAGKRTKYFEYSSGLTLVAVGLKTSIENVMVSYCKGNSFNIIGGHLNLNKLVSYKSHNNDYEFNLGAQVDIYNSMAIKTPYNSGPNTSRGLNILAFNDKNDVDLSKKQTAVSAQNLTLINLSNDLANTIKIGLVTEGIFIGENATFNIHKSVISGFNPAVLIDENIKLNQNNLQQIKFSSTYFNNCNGNIFIRHQSNNEDLENWYGHRSFTNVYSKGPDSETFIDANNSRRPDFRLKIKNITATSSTD